MFKFRKASAGMHANLLLWLSLSILVSLVFLLALRVGFLHYSTSNTSPSLLFNNDFWQALFTGLRFDIAILLRAFLPIYLLSLLAIPFPQIMKLLKMCMRMHQAIKLTKFYSSINSLIPSALT